MKFGLLLFSLLFSSLAYGQETIRGMVCDETDSAGVMGVVVDCTADSVLVARVVTDGKGKFAVTADGRKTTLVKFTHVGYAPYFLSLPVQKKQDIDLGVIYLKPADTALGEVTVVANANRIDRTLVIPSKQDVRVSEDFYGLLLTMNLRNMKVDVLNKKVTVGGKRPLWKINGIPKDESEIATVRPQNVERIEYSDLPSAREADRGYGGVVNIILKKQDNGVMIAANAMTAFTTGYVNGGVQALYHKDKNDFYVTYSTSYRGYRKWTKDENSLFISPVDTIVRNATGVESRFGYISQNINLGFMRAIDARTAFSITLRNPLYYQHNIPKSILQNGVNRETNSSYRGYTPAVDVFFGKTFSNNDRLELNVVGTYSLKGKSLYTTTDVLNGQNTGTYTMPADTKRRSLIWEAFYSHNFGQMRLMVGVQNTMGKSTNTYYNPSVSRDELSENNTYAYTQLSGALGKLQYSLGTGLKYNNMDNGQRREYWRNQSQLTLSYSPSKNLFLRYYGVYYPTMPSLFALTSVVQRIDDLQLLTGNPTLRSTQNFYNSMLVSYSRNKFNSDLQVTYRYADRPIFMHIDYDNGQQLFVQRYINGIYGSQLNLNYSASLKEIFGFMNVSGECGYSYFRSKAETLAHTLGNFYWSMTVQLYYKQFTLSAYMMQPRKVLDNEIISRDEKVSRIMLAWKKQNLTLTAAVFNPFTPDGSNYIDQSLSKYNPGKSKVAIHDNGNMFTLGFSWNFSFGKKGNSSKRSLNNTDSGNSILRANP